MNHDPRAYLWDAKKSAEAIAEFVRGRTFDDYAADLLLRSAVERQFEIIGEALRRLERGCPMWRSSCPNDRRRLRSATF